MSQPKQDGSTLNQILRLVEQLSVEEQGELRKKLDETWRHNWQELTNRIREHAKNLPPLTDDELAAEVKAVRQARKATGAEGSR